MRKGMLLVRLLPVIFLPVGYSLVASRLADIDFLPVFFASLFLLAAFYTHYKDCTGSKKYQFLTICILVVGLVLMAYNAVYKNLPFTGVDWYNFDHFAQSALNSSGNIFEIFGNSTDLFTAFIALLYRIFGSNITIVYFYIFPLSFLLSHYLYKTVFLVTQDKRKSLFMSTVILLMPVNFIFSFSVLREIPVQCVAIVSLYNFILYLRSKKGTNLLSAFIFAVFAALMHSGMIAILAIYLYVLMQKKFFKKVKMLRFSTILFAILILVLMSLPVFSSLTKRFDMSNGIDGVVKNVNTQNSYLLDATTNYVGGASSSAMDLVSTLPYRVSMFVVAPLPWQINSAGTLVAFFADAILRYYIVYRILKTMFNLRKYSIEDREIIETLFMSIVIFDLIFCLGTTNYGTAMRHRAKMLPFELVILSMVSSTTKKPKKLEKENELCTS